MPVSPDNEKDQIYGGEVIFDKLHQNQYQNSFTSIIKTKGTSGVQNSTVNSSIGSINTASLKNVDLRRRFKI